jgi:ribonuclease Z
VTPLLHPFLVNGRAGDPALYVETLFDRRAILFDLGDITALSPRKVNRLEFVFVSHTHIDHFIGFDRLLRLLVGRDKTLNLYGPEGFIDAVDHKLHSYQWNLVDRYPLDLEFVVTEVAADLFMRTARFGMKSGFTGEVIGASRAQGGVLVENERFRITTALLEHRIPCLAFAVEERSHVNVWRTKLDELGLTTGPWLKKLKAAVAEGWPSDTLIEANSGEMQLGRLRDVVTITKGQKIAYVADAADTGVNRAKIVELARDADMLFIEAMFAAADVALAIERAHLTTRAAGEIGTAAGARRVEPFHFSPRYEREHDRMLAEVQAAFKPVQS